VGARIRPIVEHFLSGLAAIAHGFSGTTRDADTVPAYEVENLEGFEVMIASLDDLIEAKETAGRDKDLRALGELRRIRDRRRRG
jgi:hypothetical protein